MTEIRNSYPAGVSRSEKPDNAASRERKETGRRGFLIGLGLGGAALAFGAGLSAALLGRGRSSSASSETPSPSESPSSSPEATPSATATETPSPTQEPVEPGTPSSERPKPLRSYNFANLSEFDSDKWKTLGDYDKGLACKTFFANNIDDPNVIKTLTESRADQSKELVTAWFNYIDPLIRDFCDDAQSNALFTDADGREVDAWPVLRCLADYIDVPHSNDSSTKDSDQKKQLAPHGYYGRLVEAAYEEHEKDTRPNEEDRIVLRVTKYAQMSEYEDRFPINDGKETNQTQRFSAAYCEVQEIGKDDRKGELYNTFIENQRQGTEKTRKLGKYIEYSFPRLSYFYSTKDTDSFKPDTPIPLKDIEGQ